MQSKSFDRFAGYAAILAGVLLLVYSFAFVFLFLRGQSPTLGVWLYGSAQVLGGILTTAVLIAVYYRVRETDNAFALFALVLGVVGALGSAIHGGYDLGVIANPPATNPVAAANLPSEIDPRGLLTFGVGGVALFILVWLMGRSKQFASTLVYLGYLNAFLLVVLYFGRLILLDPNNLVITGSALLNGFIVNPIFYIWVGVTLMRPAK